jgi:hypothetical protein
LRSVRSLHSASHNMSLDYQSSRASELRENMEAILSDIENASNGRAVSV